MTDLIHLDAKPIPTAPAELQATDLVATFDQAAARFLATKRKRTRQTYATGLSLYRAVALEVGADPLRADALIIFNQAMQERRRDQGGDLANDTVRARLKAVQSFFSWAWAFNLTPVKPELVSKSLLNEMPPARKLSPRDVLTAEEARALLGAAQDAEARCLIRVMLDGGLRVSEALALRCGDVYTAAGRYYLLVQAGKGDKSRDVEITADLYRDLAELAARHGLDVKDSRTGEEALFEMSRPTAWRRVKDAADVAGIERNVTPHTLRHSHAHALAMQGWALELIGERLGHASFDTTKIYTRPAKMLMQMELPAMPWAEGD
jgi:integrase